MPLDRQISTGRSLRSADPRQFLCALVSLFDVQTRKPSIEVHT